MPKTMRKKGHLKKKLRKKLEAKLGPLGRGERAVVVCVGDKCASREDNRAILTEASAHVAALGEGGAQIAVRVGCSGCLKVCKKGPIVAILPDASLYRRVTPANVDTLIDSLLSPSGVLAHAPAGVPGSAVERDRPQPLR
ncbi:MAG TPA: (2Fe-2S) ferredoxin domain-containing protein [Polyangiaceae bacterium]|nr:(2Fe-2S) ferredoxin domain-containing protein [Polyangiaceae bacterium]